MQGGPRKKHIWQVCFDFFLLFVSLFGLVLFVGWLFFHSLLLVVLISFGSLLLNVHVFRVVCVVRFVGRLR